MRHRSSSWLGLAVGVTALGLVIGSAREASPRDLDSASLRRSAAAIVARTAAAISAATAGSVLQMIVTTPQGVSRVIIDAPGQASELVRNRAGGTLSESGIRRIPGPARRYESRTVDFDLGTWSQAVLAGDPASPGGRAASIESPAGAIAAQLHHTLGAAGHAPSTRARVIGGTSLDGEPVYVLVLSGPGGPPARVWISRSSWLPVQSASPGASVDYEWTAQGTMSAGSLWPSVPAGLVRVPAE
jgi:hypothetical protein